MLFGDMPDTIGSSAQPSMTCSVFGPIHGIFSAERGDYFFAGDADEVTCGECGADMELGRLVESWQPATPAEG